MRHASLMCVFTGAWFLTSATPAASERNWEFSFGAFGGKAYHANTTERFNYANTPAGFESVDAKAIGLNFDNSGTFGAKLTAWHLPRKYDWSPQIGLELDWTSFTADIQPQTVPGEGVGKVSGLSLGPVTINSRRDFGVNNLAINLLFRYPNLGNTRHGSGTMVSLCRSRSGSPKSPLNRICYKPSRDQLFSFISGTRRRQAFLDQELGYLW